MDVIAMADGSEYILYGWNSKERSYTHYTILNDSRDNFYTHKYEMHGRVSHNSDMMAVVKIIGS